MRPSQFRLFPLLALALAVVLSAASVAPVLAKWSHPAVAPNNAVSSVVTNTSTVVPGSTTTSVVPAPSNFVATTIQKGATVVVPVGSLLTATVVSTTPALTSTPVTTTTRNADGSFTTTTTTVTTAASAAVVTTTLNIPKVSLFEVGATNPPTTVNGVTTTTVNIVYLGVAPPASGTLTQSTVATTAVPDTTTSSSTTTPAPHTSPQPVLTADDSSNVEAAVKALSEEAQNAMAACEVSSRPCFADALDAYAVALQKLAPRLPPKLRALPSIVAHAARKVRAARTAIEAVAALGTAITQIHKTIALLKADDPVPVQTETREAALVAETLQVASDKLEKATGL